MSELVLSGMQQGLSGTHMNRSYRCSSVTWAGYFSLSVEASNACFYLSKNYLESGFIYIYVHVNLHMDIFPLLP